MPVYVRDGCAQTSVHQQHASVCQGRMCSDKCRVADQTCTDPVSPGAWQVDTGVPIFKSLVWVDPKKDPGEDAWSVALV